MSGRPLAEIFSLRILNIDDEDPGQLYGTVTATDGQQTYQVYNRQRDNYESIRPGERATLTGPARAISAAKDFVIRINLFDHDTVSADDEVSQGHIAWEVYDHSHARDRFQSSTIHGQYGSASLDYAVMSNAVEAFIEVVLLNHESQGSDPTKIYGNIYSQTSTFSTQVDLFKRETRKEHIEASPNKPIPLLRSAVAVPLDASLRITAKLWNSHSDNNEIAMGSVIFTPSLFKQALQFIQGPHCTVQVLVRWS